MNNKPTKQRGRPQLPADVKKTKHSMCLSPSMVRAAMDITGHTTLSDAIRECVSVGIKTLQRERANAISR